MFYLDQSIINFQKHGDRQLMLDIFKNELRHIFADLFDEPYELNDFEINEFNFIKKL